MLCKNDLRGLCYYFLQTKLYDSLLSQKYGARSSRIDPYQVLSMKYR